MYCSYAKEMKVVVYSIRPFEKEFLAKANQKKHDITLISNPLSIETAVYAEGKDAVVVLPSDDVSANVICKLADLGIKYITSRSATTDHIDKQAAAEKGIKLAYVPDNSPKTIAEQTIRNLDLWQQNKCVGNACACMKNCRVVQTGEIIT